MRDDTRAVLEAIRQIARAAIAPDTRASEAKRVASEKTIRSVERIASADPAIAARAGDWDTDPFLLNTPAAIVHLESGELIPHDPGRMLTQITQASPGAASTRWGAFLDEVTGGDAELAAYLARLGGYCLSGSTEEQVFVFLHGSGANGKSVFLQAISQVLGTYAATAPLGTFMASRNDAHPTDLAGLVGKRLVTVTETEAGRAWAESRIKAITGGDPIRARFMNKDFFEFTPTFKLAVAGNHRPRLAGVGEAMRRRMHLVPFTVTIPPERRDKRLLERLLEERDGILGWLIDGYADWRETGLAPPASVLQSAEEYFAGRGSRRTVDRRALRRRRRPAERPARACSSTGAAGRRASALEPGLAEDARRQLCASAASRAASSAASAAGSASRCAARPLRTRSRRMNPLHPRHMTPEGAPRRGLRPARPRPHPAPRCASQAKYLLTLEKVRYTSRPTRAVMQTRNDGEPHDRQHPRARGRAEDHADARAEGAVARRSSTPSRRPSTGGTSRTGSPTASRSWPTAG